MMTRVVPTSIGILLAAVIGCARGSDDLTEDAREGTAQPEADASVDARDAADDGSRDATSATADATVHCDYIGGTSSGDPGSYRFSEQYVCDGRVVFISCNCAQQTCSCGGKDVETQCENGVFSSAAVRTSCGVNVRPPGAGSK